MEDNAINLHTASIQSLYDLVKKKVSIKMVNGSTYIGWIQSVDPVSKSLIVLQFEHESVTLRNALLIPGVNVKYIEVSEDNASFQTQKAIESLFKREEVIYNQDEIVKRREALCMWLSNNRVPYTVTGDMCIEVLQAATISPPFNNESIQCKNEVVLDKVMKLVAAAPGLQ